MASLARPLTVVICIAAIAVVDAAKIKIKADRDKTFDFKKVQTYLWNPSGAGEVKLLQASHDNAAELRARFEPVIVPAVEETLASRRLTKAVGGAAAELRVSYYVLIGPNADAQTMGQFLAPVPQWGLPPFAPATQSLEIYEQGTLIVDLASVAEDSVVWRGSASVEIDRQNSDSVRNARIRDGIQGMFKKLPRK